MRWQDGRRSGNVEDRRGAKAAAGGAVGIGGVLVAIVYVMLGGDPNNAVQVATAVSSVGAEATPAGAPAADDALAQMVSVVLADTEDVWTAIFQSAGKTYQQPKLVLFTDSVNSACGRAGASIGPFYCPADYKAYIDLSFYDQLRRRFGAPGDFAQAYVIAHEVGHHVQNLLGISAQADRAGRGKSEAEVNALSVRQELQADCFAGVWAHHADKQRHLLEAGDVEEALRAAEAIGDDTLQRQSQGTVAPESFTHGTSAMRQKWLMTGMKSGSIADCDTFNASAAAVGL
jgi:predicted metalloprotease